MLGYTNDQQNRHMTLGIQVPLLISRHGYVLKCYGLYACATLESTS